jgi:hypothetical protein
MVHILHEQILECAVRTPNARGLIYHTQQYDIAHLENETAVAGGLGGLCPGRGKRIAA